MTAIYVTLKDAAIYENLDYFTFQKRIKRNSDQYIIQTQPRETGGKPEIMVAVSSLSAKAQRAWRAAQKADGRDAIIDSKSTEVRP